jgi:hypothetical protein
MSYPIQVVDPAERKVLIDQELDGAPASHGVVFRGERKLIPVVRLPIHVPIYRMANGRTDVAQLEYITENGADPDFFAAGENNQSAQSAQHGILLLMSKAATGPIYQELAEVARQDEPLLVTATGVVVNGNRRLAAMRDLLQRDASRYHGFSHVDVAILPGSAREIDLEVIETQLQMVPDTKLDYGWIEERRKLRRLRDQFGMSLQEISGLMRTKEDDINRLVEELELAEEYLETFLNQANSYRYVATNEQLFKELAKELRKKRGAERELARLIGFNLVHAADSLDNRAYHFREAFGRNATEVIRRLALEEGLTFEPSDSSTEIDDDDPLSGLTVEDPPYVSPLREVLGDSRSSHENASRIAAIHQNLKNEKDDENARSAALNGVTRANKILHQVDWTSAASEDLESIAQQLSSIIRLAERLRNEIAASSETSGRFTGDAAH